MSTKLYKGMIIKLDDGKYKLFCLDREYAVFGKVSRRRNGAIRTNFLKTATFSSLKEHRHFIIEKLVR